MKDFMGVELAVGDNIVMCVGHGRNAGASLSKAVVIGFTEKFVRVTPTHSHNKDPRLTDPKKTIRMVSNN